MENEIELKIMLLPENIPVLKQWINAQPILEQGKELLGNTYYDSPALFFANNKMGLRVRHQNQQYELTLKMKGEIVGGLHIRPEYNLALPDAKPDFKRLVFHFNLPFPQADLLDSQLQPTFSTDFVREKWLITTPTAQIEIALDQGKVKNPFGEEAICEVEFELKQGMLADLIAFLDTLPKQDGMWFSSLSKAQRGYLVGQPDQIAKEIDKLTACDIAQLSEKARYQLEQQLVDFWRLTQSPKLAEKLATLYPQQAMEYFTGREYFKRNLEKLNVWI
ncbi:CYTH domain-containing protein [Glaesserella parasuis]|uniref:CYTH domain-containing protein n=1 Tax=Glaesserella parasuis TaxID=738 RepID=UPI0009502D84|nr:CYTH domain-containing protein [Glaesserella parasuis]MCT8553361.1 CYTH domain-containing protein [Glaesserella parasuis]MCT8559895.1 CYTH domain-containing protein [Glaesserella parasuis]MCT8581839.1 CYTH domain-containing protein [Glaesserella parasuis]MCT8586026.1 CYTH domain-containing protein [Glaesserella parasuis]MCT8756836.1 CYTH domain-containing protein [Glaesserella parasuis]